MAPISDYKEIHMKFGLHGSNDAGASSVTVQASDVTLHPNYNNDNLRNDIMLIKLPDNFNHNIPESGWAKFTTNDFPVGQELTVAGWGVSGDPDGTSGGPFMPNSLLKVDVPTVSNAQCTGKFKKKKIMTDLFMCFSNYFSSFLFL